MSTGRQRAEPLLPELPNVVKIPLWGKPFHQLVYRLSAYLRTKGVRTDSVGRRLIRRVNHPLMKFLANDEPFLTTVHGIPLYIYPNTFETVAYLCQPFEPYTTALFERAVSPGATILDLGAQFGYFSLIAAKRVGPEGRVYAFEPALANFTLLERNIRMNGYAEIIHPVQQAVGDHRARVTFFVYDGSDSHGMHRHPRVAVKETTEVECIALDEWLGGQAVDVVKMDIEGQEPYALQGMKQTIARSDRLILFAEFAPAYLRRAGVEPQDYLEQLVSLGFDVHLIDEESRCLKPIPRDHAWRTPPTWHANVYCRKRH